VRASVCLTRQFCILIHRQNLHVCLTDGQGSRYRQGRAARAGQARPGKKTWEILGYGFQDMVFRIWDLNFGAWEILGYVFRIWDLNFGAWEILGYGFQELGSQLWGLVYFRIWFSRHGFQDMGSQLWGLDFHTRDFQDRNLKTFRM